MSEQQPQHREGSTPADAERRELGREQIQPRIWIGSLADYNAGRLHGEWIAAAVDGEDLVDAARDVVASSPEPGAEEWGIFDYEGFGNFRVGQYESLDIVARVARGITEHGRAFAAWAELHDVPDMLGGFEDAFCGSYDSREAWAEEMLESMDVEQAIETVLPDWLQRYVRIDRAALAHDMELGGEVWIEDNPEGGIWVFDARA